MFSCDYLGGGTIEYRVTNAGTGVPFSVEATPLGPLGMITQPMGLTGPNDSGSFIVSCTGAGPCGVTLTCRAGGGQIVNQCGVCFDCPSNGGMLIERPCSTQGVPVPAASRPMIGALFALLILCGLIALRRCSHA